MEFDIITVVYLLIVEESEFSVYSVSDSITSGIINSDGYNYLNGFLIGFLLFYTG